MRQAVPDGIGVLSVLRPWATIRPHSSFPPHRSGASLMTVAPVVVDHPLVQHNLTLLRRRETPSEVFRRAMRETGAMLLYEATRDLPVGTQTIETPMAAYDAPVLAQPVPALVSILRAGNGLIDGMLDIMPYAAVGHIGIYRDHETLEAHEYYFHMPADLDRRPVIVGDPMLATANTAVAAITRLKQAGARDLRFVCLLAAPEGVAALAAAHPDLPVITAAIDDRLDERGYIIPGLGDAGDRTYGTEP